MAEHVHEWRISIGLFSGEKENVRLAIGCKCGESLFIEEAERRLNATERYQELIMAVGNKYDGETRHETALRYILEAEQGSDVAYTDILEGK